MPRATALQGPKSRASAALLTMLAMLAAPIAVIGAPGTAQAATTVGAAPVGARASVSGSTSAPARASSAARTAAATTLSKNVTANLFEYNWPSVGSACTNVLGPDGYAAVQVSPPEDSLQAAGDPWWQVYQPVDYNLTSMMGTQAQFQAMVTACHAAGVKVYVDAVLNHMAAQPTSGSGTSVGGQSYDPAALSYPAYSASDFHSYPADCPESSNAIVNWLSFTEVTECQLEGLPDLATETTYVRNTEAAYLNALIADGVDGFRLDSAAEIGETDIGAIEALLHPDTSTGAPVYVTQEVYPGSSGQDSRLNPTSFEPEGSVTSFDYSYALTDDFQGNDIAALNSFSPKLPSAYASSFVTNQDTERASPPTLNYTNGAQYVLADEFLLAYGYGTPQIYSSFDFSSYNQAPPINGSGQVTNTVCGTGAWECTEQTPAIDALVGWHNLAYTDNDPVQNWTTDGNNLIAFSRGSDAWIALNNGSGALTATFPTGLANGTYCDIVNDTDTGGTCSGPGITVSGGSATVTVPAQDAVALDINALATTTGPPPPAGPLSETLTASSAQSGYPAANANDGNTSTYWESTDGAGYPQTLTANLGSVQSLGSVTLDLPPATAWSTRTETFSVLGSVNGSTWNTLVGSANYTFNPATGNTVSFTLPSGTSEQYLELDFSANTGWSAAQISEFQIFAASSGTGSATLAASPASLSFGNETVGSTSAAQNVTITNTGTAAATISSVTTGSPFGHTTTCGTTLSAGATCTVSVTFTPTATGNASANLTVSSNATNSTLTIGLTGTGTAAASATLTASPTSLSFGSQTVGSTSAAQNVTITNTGTAAATISSVTTGSPFGHTTTCGTTLSAGATCTVSVTFTPTATGSASANLTVSSNATNSTLTVGLSGTGTAAASATLTTSPTSLSFGSQNVGSSSAAQTVTITNTGGATATISSISAGAPFSVTTTCGSTLAAGASCTASVTFTPTAAGNASANLTISSNATDPSLTVPLSGTGTSSGGTPTNLALNAPITASSYTQNYAPTNADDGNTSTYWEGTNGAWPTTLTVNLGAADTLDNVVLDLPPSSSWGTRTQTIAVDGSQNDSTWTTLVGSGTYTFNPSTGNTVTIGLPANTVDQYVQLVFTANSVQNGAQLSEFQVMGTGTAHPDLALNASISASSYTQNYAPTNADDGNTSTYWEGTNGAWPTTLTVNLGASHALGSVVLDLPPSSSWGTRTQTLSVLGSANGSSYTTLVSSATYTWNPASGNTVTIPLPAGTSDQYVQLSFTANNVQNGAQLSELDVYGP